MKEYAFHPLADLVPPMTDDEFEELVDSIKRNGQMFHVVLYEGKILDGRHRYKACRKLGLPTLKTEKYTGNDPVGFVTLANLSRRHLTPGQKRELIVKLLKQYPAKSNREIARNVKSDGKTVASVRKKMEASAEIPHIKPPKARKTPNPKAGGPTFKMHLPPEVSATLPKADRESARCLAEFKTAVNQWLPKLNADDLKEARAYFQDRAEAREKANGARATKSAEQSVEERKAANTKLAEQEEYAPTQ